MQREKIEIKGSKDGFYVIFEKGVRLTQAISLLQEKLEENQAFFRNSYFTQIISDTLSRNDKQMIGIFMQEEYDIRLDQSFFGDTSVNDSHSEIDIEQEVNRRVEEAMKNERKKVSVSLQENVISSKKTEMQTFFVQETLRSGGDIQFDGHVVVIGDINPGARVTASGNIIILGYLRGIAHAGAKGDKNCFVVAERLAPIQLRIASAIAIASENNSLIEEPLIAKISNDTIVIEPILLRR